MYESYARGLPFTDHPVHENVTSSDNVEYASWKCAICQCQLCANKLRIILSDRNS